MNRTYALAILAAVVLAGLAWIDPLYIPLILLGPPVSGFALGNSGVDWRPLVAAWVLAGLATLAIDLAVNHEDAAFHGVVTLLTAGLARLGWAAGRRTRRSTDKRSGPSPRTTAGLRRR